MDTSLLRRRAHLVQRPYMSCLYHFKSCISYLHQIIYFQLTTYPCVYNISVHHHLAVWILATVFRLFASVGWWQVDRSGILIAANYLPPLLSTCHMCKMGKHSLEVNACSACWSSPLGPKLSLRSRVSWFGSARLSKRKATILWCPSWLGNCYRP